MCGIIGYVGRRRALDVLLEGLRRLEYRGYDSAGVVVQNGHGLSFEKCVGRIGRLEARVHGRPLPGRAGLGHTRWATHGGVNRSNAHPHFSCDGKVAVVHNGIVENLAELREELRRHRFRSETDTEVIPHLIEEGYERTGGNLLRSVQLAVRRIRGSLALGVIHSDHPNFLAAARVQCPLVLGLGEGEQFLASDPLALAPYTRRIVPLEEGELAEIDPDGSQIFDGRLAPRARRAVRVTGVARAPSRNGHAYFMAGEIGAQPRTLAAELRTWSSGPRGVAPPRDFDRVVLVACGTAWHAAQVAKVALEELVGIPAEAALASELRYGDHPFGKGTLTIAVSQSGETADTLASVRSAREAGSTVLAVTNVGSSSLAREADRVLLMRAGPEIGVAATKTYTSQLLNLLLLALHLGRARGALPRGPFQELLRQARLLPGQAGRVLARADAVRRWARRYREGHPFMFIGRRYNLATAYEGALKMKELTYLPAEGYGAGEMKHGPLALVDERMVCVAVAPRGRVAEKMISNIQEVRARGGRVLSVATEGDRAVAAVSEEVVEIPPCEEMFSPVLAVLPLQLLAYHRAVALGRDVDRPRNLAKSVTVE